jgi:catechol 2,3-dioxygenase-like lactoylglutathione lyase family enzyme
MTDLSSERPARRFLHICYCCPDADEATTFFVDGLSLINTMRTTDQYNSGAVLGMDRDVRSVASFVYDRRGPRTSPAMEIQGWYDPTPIGVPSTDAVEIGIKALGFAVPALDDAVERLVRMECSVIADSKSPFDDRQVTVLDPLRIMLELVEDSALAADESRLHHLRLSVTRIDQSLPFYDMLGFEVVDRGSVSDGAFVGLGAPVETHVDAEFAVLRLPDEPFQLRLIQWNSPAGHGRHYNEPNHAGLYRAALGVDDTRASYDQLTAAGAVFDRPPMEVELSGTPVPDMWITFITDPDGIPYEFVQRPRSAFR